MGRRTLCPYLFVWRGSRRLFRAQLWRKQNPPRCSFVSAYSVDHRLCRLRAKLVGELINGRKRRHCRIAVVQIIESYKRNIVGTVKTCLAYRGQHSEGNQVIRREDGSGPLLQP